MEGHLKCLIWLQPLKSRNLGNENSINGLVRSRTAMIKSQTGRKNVWFNSVYEQLKFN